MFDLDGFHWRLIRGNDRLRNLAELDHDLIVICCSSWVDTLVAELAKFKLRDKLFDLSLGHLHRLEELDDELGDQVHDGLRRCGRRLRVN